MKRFLAAFLTLAILLTGLTLTASAATTGWVKDGDYMTYVKADGKLAENEWIQDGGKWYYFSGTMMAADGIWQINETWYAFGKDGAMVANDWYEQKWSFEEDGETYSGSDWYYAGKDGALLKGWQRIGGKWYYFLGAQKNETDYSPFMMKGMWFDYDEESGEYISEFDDGKFYAFKPSGELIIGWGQLGTSPESAWVYGNADGSCDIYSWKKIGGKWYYFDDTGWMLQDTITGFIDGKPWNWGEGSVIYAFDKSGAMIENRWYKPEWSDSTWYYLGKDGAAQKGWIKDGGKWYYLDPDYAYMWNDGRVQMLDGNTYYFDKNTGEMKTGWVQDEDYWFFFKDSGAMAKEEWIMSGGSWYYVDETGEMVTDDTLTIDGQEYKFGKDGAWINE